MASKESTPSKHVLHYVLFIYYLFDFNEMHYLLLTFSLILHYLYRYIFILNVFIYVYEQLSAIMNLYYILCIILYIILHV